MVVGNTYSLLVTYDNGRKQTNTLRFQYQKDGSLKIYGYQHNLLGNTQKPGKIICSYDTGDEKYLSRCAAYAVKTGGSLKQIEKELEISHPTVVGLVQRLETKGFVESFTDEKDRRIKMVLLTERAYEHQHFMETRFREKEKLMTRGMSEAEVQELIRLLRKLHTNLENDKEDNDI